MRYESYVLHVIVCFHHIQEILCRNYEALFPLHALVCHHVYVYMVADIGN